MMIEQSRNHVREAYTAAIGRPRRQLATPALILGLDVAHGNIQAMQRRMAGLKAKLRRHIKVQKCVVLAQLQIEAGAIGVVRPLSGKRL